MKLRLLAVMMTGVLISACGGSSGGSEQETTAQSDVFAARSEKSRKPVKTKPDPVVTEPDPVVTEPDPVVTEPDPVVTEPDPVVTEPDPVVTEPTVPATVFTLNESFDTLPLTTFGAGIDSRPNTVVKANAGVGGTSAMQVSYVGGDNGSDRVIYNQKIPTQQTYSLGFDVYFPSNFDFANGGKMHGLFPSNPVTGGNAVGPDEWSARIMWRVNGRLQTYVYHQDMSGTYGTVKQNNTFYLQKGQWYAFTAIVKVNDYGQYNGYMQIWVNGVKLIDHTGIRFRNDANANSLINQVTFNTFHGGNSASYAPRDADGNITTVQAYYDNFALTPGVWVKSAVGPAK